MPNKITFIAELGLNAHGDIDKMKRMCKRAHEAGATYLKGQYYCPPRVLGKDHPALQYAIKCQFTRKQHEEIAHYCDNFGGKYFVSVFNIGDVGWANSFCPVHKIASRMNRNPEFIAAIEKTKKPVFMSVQPDVDMRIPERFKLMWCIREYPTMKKEVLEYPYNSRFGFSSHCPDPSATIAAAKLGAITIENHVCESREEEGCDIPSSLTLDEYALVIKTLATS